MKALIQTLHIRSRNIARQRAFYAHTLGFEVVEAAADSLVLQIGRSRLIFHEVAGHETIYHFSLRIPEAQFDEAVKWLEERVPLLQNSTGETSFHFESWNAHAVYFHDADGNIGELIARHAVADDAISPFDTRSVLEINEIGIVVPDVPAAVQKFETEYGLTPYLGRTADDFTAVGDAHGLLIVSRIGRPWYPVGIPAVSGWVKVDLSTQTGLQTLNYLY